MKRLFTLDINKSIWVEKNEKVFRIHDNDSNRLYYLDWSGNEVAPPVFEPYDYTCELENGDPTWFKYLGNGFYAYTTHPVDETMDGEFGCFGVKDSKMRIIVEEQYWQIGTFSGGLCPVQEVDGNWGCINEKGDLVLPCVYWDEPVFNIYGLAYGNQTLIDMQGNEIPNTAFNHIEFPLENNRYYKIVLTNEEQRKQIEKTGSAEGITEDIFDTRLREYVIKGIPECVIYWFGYDGEPEPIIEATKLIDKYEKITVDYHGILIGKSENKQDVYDCYMQ